jgi:electron transfer flavoprotein beta subunit
MGPPMAEDSLRKALTFGADRAVLLTDRFFAGSDTLATSYALACAIQKIGEVFGKPDIVFAGKQTIDGDTAQVGPGIARRLALLQLTYISKINTLDLEEGTIEMERRAEGGTQMLKTAMPCLITMLEGSNEMRRGSLNDALRAARADVTVWSAEQAGIPDILKCGLRGSPTVVKRVFAPSPRAEKAKQIELKPKPSETADDVIEAIFAAKATLASELSALAAGH